MLEQLSNNTHNVITACCFIDLLHKNIIRSCKTIVSFNLLSAKDIEHYIYTGNSLDKAGSYGIQDTPKSFIKSIKGLFIM